MIRTNNKTVKGRVKNQSWNIPRASGEGNLPTAQILTTQTISTKIMKINTLNTKIEQLTTPVKYRAYPNKKLRRFLERCMDARRKVWNYMLGIQKKYYEAIRSYAKSQLDKDTLDNLSEIIETSEDKKELKKAKKEYHKLIKSVEVPVAFGIKTIKEIDPNIDEDVIEKMIPSHKDPSLANHRLDTFELRRQIKFHKKLKGNEWLNTVSSAAVFNAAFDLKKAWKMKFEDETNKFGVPRFKSYRDKQSCRISDCKVDLKTGKITLPKVKLKLKIKAHRDIGGIPKDTTFEKDKVGNFWASVNFRQDYEYSVPDAETLNKENTLGIDMGIKDDFVILSNGETYKNPKYLKSFEKRLAILHRALSRAKKDSKGREKILKKLNVLCLKLKRAREDFIHKTTDKISKDEKFKCIAVEDLNVAGMIRKNKPKKDENGKFVENKQSLKRGFNKATSDASMGKFLQTLEYKAKRNGKLFVKIDRFFASSKLCNNCGHKKEDLKVNEQHWDCPECKTRNERNHNAAANIRDEGLKKAQKV